MANALGNYNEVVYAQEGLTQLISSLGMASRVSRGAEAARNASFAKGDTIKLRRPSSFTAQTAPSTTAQDIATDAYDLKLDQWSDVLIQVRDDEMSFTRDEMLKKHVVPAMVALAVKMDAYIKTLFINVADFIDVGATAALADLTAANKALFDNNVAVDELEAQNKLHFLVDSDIAANFQSNTSLNQAMTAGAAGLTTLQTGRLGKTMGFEIFRNQSVPAFTCGTCSVTALLINNGAGYAKGIATINVDAASVTGTLVAGDILTIGGKNYVVTTGGTFSGNELAGVVISPPLEAAVVDNATVTFKNTTGKNQCLAFAEDFMGFAAAPLSDNGNARGADIGRAFDPVTGIGVRVSSFYDAINCKNYMRVDALYGAKVYQPRMAVRAYN